jgi:hypothetical protein
VIARNVSIGGKWDEYSEETGVYLKFEDNLVLGDEALPVIADPKRPKAAKLVKGLTSMKLPAGFKPLPIEKMGVESR